MTLVHTTFREKPFEMPEDEAAHLGTQGLLRETPPAGDGGTPAGTAVHSSEDGTTSQPQPKLKKENA